MNFTTSQQPKLLTVREVATYLAVNKRTVYRLLKAHHLPAYRIGGQWRFKLEVIEGWMRRGGAPDEPGGAGRKESGPGRTLRASGKAGLPRAEART
jgi:excisionase family DNA binding protein